MAQLVYAMLLLFSTYRAMASYSIQYGSTACPAALGPKVSSLSECMEAAGALSKSYGGEVNSASMPKSCFLNETDVLKFNTHASGAAWMLSPAVGVACKSLMTSITTTLSTITTSETYAIATNETYASQTNTTATETSATQTTFTASQTTATTTVTSASKTTLTASQTSLTNPIVVTTSLTAACADISGVYSDWVTVPPVWSVRQSGCTVIIKNDFFGEKTGTITGSVLSISGWYDTATLSQEGGLRWTHGVVWSTKLCADIAGMYSDGVTDSPTWTVEQTDCSVTIKNNVFGAKTGTLVGTTLSILDWYDTASVLANGNLQWTHGVLWTTKACSHLGEVYFDGVTSPPSWSVEQNGCDVIISNAVFGQKRGTLTGNLLHIPGWHDTASVLANGNLEWTHGVVWTAESCEDIRGVYFDGVTSLPSWTVQQNDCTITIKNEIFGEKTGEIAGTVLSISGWHDTASVLANGNLQWTHGVLWTGRACSDISGVYFDGVTSPPSWTVSQQGCSVTIANDAYGVMKGTLTGIVLSVDGWSDTASALANENMLWTSNIVWTKSCADISGVYVDWVTSPPTWTVRQHACDVTIQNDVFGEKTGALEGTMLRIEGWPDTASVLMNGSLQWTHGIEWTKSPAAVHQVSMTVEGVDYNSITGDEHAMNAFLDIIKEGVASQAGDGSKADNVFVFVLPGSVKVHATVVPPTLGQAWVITALKSSSIPGETFHEGDTGIGYVVDWMMHITWSDGQTTKTNWPNASWFSGRPRSAGANASDLASTFLADKIADDVRAVPNIDRFSTGSISVNTIQVEQLSVTPRSATTATTTVTTGTTTPTTTTTTAMAMTTTATTTVTTGTTTPTTTTTTAVVSGTSPPSMRGSEISEVAPVTTEKQEEDDADASDASTKHIMTYASLLAVNFLLLCC